MSRYIISPSASRDLEHIIDDLSEQSIDAGEQIFGGIWPKMLELGAISQYWP